MKHSIVKTHNQLSINIVGVSLDLGVSQYFVFNYFEHFM